MASVHRDPKGRSPYWYAAFTLQDGTRCFRSTKLKDRSSALKLAMEWEHLGRTVAERDPVGVQISRVNLDIYERATGNKVEVVYLGDFLREWYQRASIQKSHRTTLRYKQVIEDFLVHIGSNRAKSNIGGVREADIQSFLEKEAKDGKSATTVGIAAKVLRIPFNLALKQGIILRQPVSSLIIPEGSSRQKKAFSWEQIWSLIAAAKDDWVTTIMLGAYCGMRLGDCINLTWDCVDLNSGTITFIPEKTSHGRRRKQLEIAIHSELRLHLEKLKADLPEGENRICPSLHGKPVSGRSGVSRFFTDSIMPAAGINPQVTQPKKEGKGRAFSALSFHSLRHSNNSEMANQGVSQEIRRKIVGHTTDRINDGYTHLSKQLIKEAVEKLPGRKPHQKPPEANQAETNLGHKKSKESRPSKESKAQAAPSSNTPSLSSSKGVL